MDWETQEGMVLLYFVCHGLDLPSCSSLLLARCSAIRSASDVLARVKELLVVFDGLWDDRTLKWNRDRVYEWIHDRRFQVIMDKIQTLLDDHDYMYGAGVVD